MSKLTKEQVKKRMKELMLPVEQQIMMCDNEQELLMMGCAMMQRTHEIFSFVLGEDGAKLMYEDLR